MSRVLTVLLLLNLPACYSWQSRTLDQQRRDTRPATLRFTHPQRGNVVLEDGVVVGDSLIGNASGSDARVALGAQGIQVVAVRRLDPAITTAFGLGFLVAGTVVVGLLTSGTCGSGAAGAC